MKISALEEYGLRCLIRLGRGGDGNSLTVNEIADNEGLSVANVRKLLMILRAADLIESVRGRAGGYALKADPEEIRIGDVIAALGGRLYDDAFCDRHSGRIVICAHSGACSVRSLWGVLDGLVGGVLNRIRLSDLIGNEEQATLSLRGHLEATIEEMLGEPAPETGNRTDTAVGREKADPSLRSG